MLSSNPMRWRWWQLPCVLRVVIVNMKHDSSEAVKGAVWEVRGPWVCLRDVSILRPGAEPQPVDGEVILHRENISFLQVLP